MLWSERMHRSIVFHGGGSDWRVEGGQTSRDTGCWSSDVSPGLVE